MRVCVRVCLCSARYHVAMVIVGQVHFLNAAAAAAAQRRSRKKQHHQQQSSSLLPALSLFIYPKQLWCCFCCFIFFIFLVRFPPICCCYFYTYVCCFCTQLHHVEDCNHGQLSSELIWKKSWPCYAIIATQLADCLAASSFRSSSPWVTPFWLI